MVVSRKRNPVKSERGRGHTKVSTSSGNVLKGSLVIRDNTFKGKIGNIDANIYHGEGIRCDNSFSKISDDDGISEARENQVISTQEMDLCQEALNKGKMPEGRVLEVSRIKSSQKSKQKGVKGLEVKNSKSLKGGKSQKRSLFESDEVEELSQHFELPSNNGYEGDNVRDVHNSTSRLGNAIQEQDYDHSRRGYRTDKGCFDGSSGVVRQGAEPGLEAFVFNNPTEYTDGRFTSRSPSMEPHSQSVVEVLHGSSRNLIGEGRGAEQAAETSSHASLGRDRVDYTRKEVGGFQGNGHGSFGESSHLEFNPVNGPNSEVRCASMQQGGHLRYSEAYDGVEARLGGFQGHTEEDGMEYGGDNHDEL
nr:hypothetical protein CFP56_70623 [Quercus suber]